MSGKFTTRDAFVGFPMEIKVSNRASPNVFTEPVYYPVPLGQPVKRWQPKQCLRTIFRSIMSQGLGHGY